MNPADSAARRDGPRLDAVTADLVARFGRERPGVYSLDRMRSLMAHLGSPQETYRVVHVAGTSGKTSTCYSVRDLLEGAGTPVLQPESELEPFLHYHIYVHVHTCRESSWWKFNI